MRIDTLTRFLVFGSSLLLTAPSPVSAYIVTSGCASATSCTLSELFGGGMITVNTKRFANWELEQIDPDGAAPNFALIVVEGKDDGGINPGNGLRFNGNSQLLVTGANRLDMAVGFTVTEMDPSSVDLTDNSLAVITDAVAGTGFYRLGEFVADDGGAGIGQKQVENDPSLSPPVTSDAIQFPVAKDKLTIEKDFLLVGSLGGDSVEIGSFEQRFSQLPEPSGALALGAGSLALLILGGRRTRRARRPDSRSNSTRGGNPMTRFITTALALAALAAPAHAQFAPPSGGETSAFLKCFYECKPGPLVQGVPTYQEITTVLLSNQAGPHDTPQGLDPGNRVADIFFIDGRENCVARSRTDLSVLDLDEISVCHTIDQAGIAVPQAGLVEIYIGSPFAGPSTPPFTFQPGDGGYALDKNVVGKFRRDTPEPFAGRVIGIGKFMCQEIPAQVQVGAAIAQKCTTAVPLVPAILVENTQDSAGTASAAPASPSGAAEPPAAADAAKLAVND